MRVAIAQLNPTSGDVEGNTAKVLEAIDAVRRQGADLLVTPEMVVPGYCIGDLVEDAAFLEANRRAVERVAREARDIAVVVGFVEYEPGARNEGGNLRKYNAAAVLQNGKVLQIARKSLLPNYRYFDDKRFFTPGSERSPVTIHADGARRAQAHDVRVGVSICEDMWDEFYQVKPIPELAAKGADVILNLNASPFYPGKRHERDVIIRRHIQQTRKPFIYVNTCGAGDNGKNIIPFDGESLIYDRSGRLIAIGRQFVDELLLVDIDAQAPSRYPIELPALERDREIYDALVMGLRDYAHKTGFTRAIIPLSGGIDSALALAIVVDAFGPGNVAAYNLPSRFNTEATRSIAARLAAAFGVRYGIIPIQDIDDKVRAIFEQHAHPIARGQTRENLHARIRGLLMMAESNDTDALLISCGNETEIALGYATLYGDMCGGISIIGDLSKVDVYQLARYVNRCAGVEKIPEDAFRIKPSAELAADQSDPFDYDVVAPVVGEFIEKRRSPADLLALFERRALDPARFLPDPQGLSVYDKHTPTTFKEVVEDTFQRLRRSVYKRLQGPPIIVVSARAFGFDLRETIINGWEGQL